MKKNFFNLFNLSIFVLLASLGFLISKAAAVSYPIAELGNCRSEQDCANYCDDLKNIDKCLNYAEKNGMMSADELKEARIAKPFIEQLGCGNKNECEAVCKQDKNLMKCVELAYKLGEVSQKDYEAMRKTGGKGPGGCKLDECDAYCNDNKNLNACVDFAVANGMMDSAEAAVVKKTGFRGPGNCQGKAQCDSYCNKPGNFNECLKFGIERGLVDREDGEIVLGTGSTKKEDVDRYCSSNDEIHRKCQKMMVRNGDLKEADVVRENLVMDFARKNCGITVWDWKTMQECSSRFCSQDGNMEECLKYEISIGDKTQADYDKWLRYKAESEKQGKN